MSEVLQRLLTRYASLPIAVGVALGYLLLFLIAIGDITPGNRSGSSSLIVMQNWSETMLRERSAFQFEAVAVLETSLFVWLVSPVNVAIGLTLGLMTGLQVALVRIARRCAAACGLGPATGILASLPGLLAGSACCAPMLFLLLGLQVTASLVTLMGLMIPVAFLLLTIGLAATARVASRHCSSSAPEL